MNLPIATLDPNELTWELLGAYEISKDYEAWCELVGLEATNPAADHGFALIHAAYAELWNAMGDAFFTRLERFADRWKERATGSNRTGKRRLVARLTGGY